MSSLPLPPPSPPPPQTIFGLNLSTVESSTRARYTQADNAKLGLFVRTDAAFLAFLDLYGRPTITHLRAASFDIRGLLAMFGCTVTADTRTSDGRFVLPILKEKVYSKLKRVLEAEEKKEKEGDGGEKEEVGTKAGTLAAKKRGVLPVAETDGRGGALEFAVNAVNAKNAINAIYALNTPSKMAVARGNSNDGVWSATENDNTNTNKGNSNSHGIANSQGGETGLFEREDATNMDVAQSKSFFTRSNDIVLPTTERILETTKHSEFNLTSQYLKDMIRALRAEQEEIAKMKMGVADQFIRRAGTAEEEL
ncbi:hypothetical protein LZ554_009538 [Drepanopeziza brunnea f. sp. 'monogermtubi']|nr:hypothetical protein LZ554_009538 [Drepanopeziza brunnea f. sp. 'monogermtubi']